MDQFFELVNQSNIFAMEKQLVDNIDWSDSRTRIVYIVWGSLLQLLILERLSCQDG